METKSTLSELRSRSARISPLQPLDPVSIRYRIVEVAREELAAQGLASMTIRQVARQAGVDPGTVRHYFPAKEDLVRAAAGADIDLAEAYNRAAAAMAGQDERGVGAVLVAEAVRYLCGDAASEAAVSVCLTGGDYQSTVFGSFDREVVTPLAQELALADGAERSAMVMAAFLGFQLLATLLPQARYPLREADVQAVLGGWIQVFLKGG